MPKVSDEMKLLEEKARAGSVKDQCELGVKLFNEVRNEYKNKEKEKKEAVEWLLIAAKNGSAEAQYYLAKAYLRGIGICIDYKETLVWMQKSAEGGFARAKPELGELLLNGVNREARLMNVEEGLKWLLIATAEGHMAARAKLNGFLFNYICGNSIAPTAWTPEIKSYIDEIKLLQKKANVDVDAASRCELGYKLYGTAAGYLWIRQAVDKGNIKACFYLCLDRISNRNHDENYRSYCKGVAILRKAAEEGNTEAQFYLFQAYEIGFDGIDGTKKINEGLGWLLKSSIGGFTEAQFKLACLYFSGEFSEIQKNEEEGLKWLRIAASKGDKKINEELNSRLNKHPVNFNAATTSVAEQKLKAEKDSEPSARSGAILTKRKGHQILNSKYESKDAQFESIRFYKSKDPASTIDEEKNKLPNKKM